MAHSETITTNADYIWYEIWNDGDMFFAYFYDAELGNGSWVSRGEKGEVRRAVRMHMAANGIM